MRRFEVRALVAGRDAVVLVDTGNLSIKTDASAGRVFSSMDADVKVITNRQSDRDVVTQVHCNVHGLKILAEFQRPQWLGDVGKELDAQVPTYEAYITLRRDFVKEAEKNAFLVETHHKFSLYEIASDHLKVWAALRFASLSLTALCVQQGSELCCRVGQTAGGRSAVASWNDAKRGARAGG